MAGSGLKSPSTPFGTHHDSRIRQVFTVTLSIKSLAEILMPGCSVYCVTRSMSVCVWLVELCLLLVLFLRWNSRGSDESLFVRLFSCTYMIGIHVYNAVLRS